MSKWPKFWAPTTVQLSSVECLRMLADGEYAPLDVRDVVHQWCGYWQFTGSDYQDIMRPYITGDWRRYDGLSSPFWRGYAKRTGRALFECEVAEHILAYHPVAICHDDDFRHQRGWADCNARFRARSARCEFGPRRAWLMWLAVTVWSYPTYRRRR